MKIERIDLGCERYVRIPDMIEVLESYVRELREEQMYVRSEGVNSFLMDFKSAVLGFKEE